MKNKHLRLFAAMLLLLLCACTSRSPAPAGQSTETPHLHNESGLPEPTRPASGSDLAIPEPYSEEAQTALGEMKDANLRAGTGKQDL